MLMAPRVGLELGRKQLNLWVYFETLRRDTLKSYPGNRVLR